MLTDAELAQASHYLFPSALALGNPAASSSLPHITDPKSSWRRLLIRAKLADLRPHDLRRSIGSWMALGGVGLPIIGAALESDAEAVRRLPADHVGRLSVTTQTPLPKDIV